MVLNKHHDPGLIGLVCISYTLISSIVRQIPHYLLCKLTKTLYIFLLLYVDDIIVTRSNPSHLSELVLQLGKEFAMKDLSPLHFFLGVDVK
ncbi:hypothetical protein KY290_013494 [Solanum tuberosum]|uniref:Reverse transcriptase Ty1/copia-type domain-containing protein n=1 Tax=Solanum tuberosum TaxID=4113 RepID=A0ABQ7VNN0_SOLTU|nr:hypothetical protein KY290_013494 [Solanum tuberosum]